MTLTKFCKMVMGVLVSDTTPSLQVSQDNVDKNYMTLGQWLTTTRNIEYILLCFFLWRV